jgi:hypothetical protein
MAEMKAMLVTNKSAFAYSAAELPGYIGVEGAYTIKGAGFEAVRSSIVPRRRLSPLEQKCLDETCKELLEAGIIQLVPTSDYISMPTMVAKKDENGQPTQKRACMDLRHINKLTNKDNYGLPRAEDLFSALGTSTVFSKLDCRSGFHQIPVAEEDQHKTTFWWGNKICAWRRLPFGLQGASSKFQRVMDTEIARAGLAHCAKAFIDDVLIHSSSPAEHIQHLRLVLEMLQRIGMRAHPGKTIVGADRVEYLGHYVSAYGLTPLHAKVAGVQALPTPTNVDTLRSVLGVVGYYRCYMPYFSVTAAPLTALFKKGAV